MYNNIAFRKGDFAMKKILLTLIFVGFFTPASLASYTYVFDSYASLPSLHGTETMLVTGNGGGGGG